MNKQPLELIGSFAGLRVLVVGEAMLDSYMTGRASRLCREAPVPIVAVADRSDMPGGAANAAVNLAGLGADVAFLSVVGDDDDGRVLRAALEERGVSTENLLIEPGRRTLSKRRVSADGQLLVRFDEGSTEPIGAETETLLLGQLERLMPGVMAVLVSDYAYGVMTPRVIAALAALADTERQVLVVDAKDVTAYRHVRATAAKPNYAEAVRMLGEPESDVPAVRVGQIAAGADHLLDATGARVVAVTLDREGGLLFERGQPAYRTYTRPNRNSRAVGAGDTFVSVLTLALAAGAGVPAAGELASAAAAVVVDKQGTATCSAGELRAQLQSRDKVVSDVSTVLARLAALGREGRRVVFTNGCFDILHRGHITYLNRAKALGDVLVVAVNSDDSVRRLKGPDRPINSLEDRALVLAALSAVDLIVPFDEDTAADLIRLIRPQVFVKGGDYTRETLPEAAVVESLGGEVRILPYLEDRSTTRILERVRAVDAGVER